MTPCGTRERLRSASAPSRARRQARAAALHRVPAERRTRSSRRVQRPARSPALRPAPRPVATPRGLTAIHALLAAGVNLVAGADNAQDPFNFVGRNDPFETAALMVMAGHMLPNDAFATISSNPRKALGMPEVSIEVGQPADLLAVRAGSTRQAIAEAPADRIVLKGGQVVARTSAMSEFPPVIT